MTGTGVLRMVRVFPAPRERVFRAWTDPEELKRWWGPGAFTTPHAEIDLRPGGHYLLVMQPPEGTPLRVAGSYREVRPPERLVYTWRWEGGVPEPGETLVEVEFRDRGEQTEVVLVHREFAAGSPGRQDPYRLGWASGLDKLAAALAGDQGGSDHAVRQS